MTNNANYKQNQTSSNSTMKNRLLDYVRKKWKFSRKPVDEQVDTPTNPTRWVQIRILPIWARILIIIVLIYIAMRVGYNIGYSVIGGGSSEDTFSRSTWRHILDIINGKE